MSGNQVCEALATKAELNDLKAKINQLLGQKEDGTGQIDVLEQGNFDGTKIGGGTELSYTAMQTITLDGDIGGDLFTALAAGSAIFSKQIGRGAKQVLEGLNKVGSAVGKNAKGLAANVKGTQLNASAASMYLAVLNQGISTWYDYQILELIKANTQLRDDQFNRWNADYSNLLQLLSQQRDDIDEAARVNEENLSQFQEQKVINLQQRTEIEDAQSQIEQLKGVNAENVRQYEDLKTQFAEFQAEVLEAQDADQEILISLGAQADNIEIQLSKTLDLITQQEETITRLLNQVDILTKRIDDLEDRILSLDLKGQFFRLEFFKLKEAFESNKDLSDARLDSLGARLTLAEKKLSEAGGGSTGNTGVRETVNTQSKLLELVASLTGTANYEADLSVDKTLNGISEFNTEYEQLISQGVNTGDVNQQQLNDLRTGIVGDLTPIINTAVPGGLGLKVDQIQSQTTPAAIASATETGICNSTQSGGCMQNNVVNPINNQVGQMINSAGTAWSAANNFLLNQINGTVNTINTTTQTIKGVVNATNGIVTHATHGLQAMQSFISKAWEATGADKILNAITTAMVIHNGVQLSTNLTATIGETASIVLDAMGIQDQEGNPIDVNGAIRAKLNALITNLIGAQTYTQLTTKLAKYNRIYQAGANVLDSARDLMDSARSVAESTAENTGRIGNALLDAGVVYEDAYDEMVDKVNPQSLAWQRLERFRNGLEAIDDTVSTIDNIASEVINTKSSYEQLKEAKDDWKEANQALVDDKKAEKEQIKLDSSVIAEIEDADFDIGTEE